MNNDLFVNFKNAKELINYFLDVTKNIKHSRRTLIDYHFTKFGDLTISELIKEVCKPKAIYRKNTSVHPLNIIATVHEPNYCYSYKSYNNAIQRESSYENIINESINTDPQYFFTNINKDDGQRIEYYIFNDMNNNKFGAIIHGHHRTILCSFLQMIDENFIMKGIDVFEYNIDWSKVNKKQTFQNKLLKNKKLFGKSYYKNVFDYELFQNRIKRDYI